LRTDADRIEHHVSYQRVVSRALGIGMPYDKAIGAVKPIVTKLSPGNRDWLARSGGLENPAIVVHLYHASQLPVEQACWLTLGDM
jgi:hypothetical protein